MDPESEILVKISKEDAGAISLTRVLQQRVSVRDLVQQVVAVTGKDEGRVTAILQRGSFVKGLSRLRWQGFAAEGAVKACLQRIPDPWPLRPFRLEEIASLQILGSREEIALPMALLQRRRWFQRSSFLDALRTVLPPQPPAYVRYDYEARADIFAVDLPAHAAQALRQAARLLRDSAIRKVVRESPAHGLRFVLPRSTHHR
ncbi:MAG: hypothetical protein MUF01_03000 [Bryobacterales bacterium]|jgi:hypothetical protein|nr:hypothetical protein [Bryobacterales bacterium]